MMCMTCVQSALEEMDNSIVNSGIPWLEDCIQQAHGFR